MGYLAGAIVLALLAMVFLGTSGCSPRNEPEKPPAVVKAVEQVKVLDRQAIRDLLKRLSETSPPPTTKLGAMCYSVDVPTRAEYICPTCGERSVYERGVAWIVDSELAACRREFNGLEEVADGAVKLDESQFCRKCRGEVQEPKLVLTLQLEEGKAQVTSGVTSEDLRILREFLTGKLVHIGETEGDESPLRDQIPRLKKLLGIQPE